MKKGFTLIELLAVIVILAIIALIAVPIILSVINETKEEAIIRSAENYLDAVELSITTSSMNDSTKEINGTYQIIDGGKKIQKDKDSPIEINFDGEGLENGTITVKDGKIKRVKNAKIGNLVYVKSFRGNTMLFNETPEDTTLLTGKEFNASIKTLVNGEEKTYEFEDTTVKSIEFLSYGRLPEGYTLKELQDLESVNVSAGNDNKIMAYYDGEENLFIYSEGLILFNASSGCMFQSFKGVESIIFNEIDTNEVTNIGYMFANCISLTNLDISSFDTSKVTRMNSMFRMCKSLTSIDVSNFDTNGVTDMSYMFQGCANLTSIDISNFDTSSVTTMASMFKNASNLKCIKVGEKWSTENKTITDIFTGCGVSSVTKDNCLGV